MKVIPSSHVILVFKDDIENRIKLYERVYKELGIKDIGFEFLFMKDTHLENLSESKQRAVMLKKRLEDIGFNEIYFSLHTPYIPPDRFSLDFPNADIDSFKRLAEVFNDSVNILNTHTQSDRNKQYFLANIDYDQKHRNMEIVVKNLEELTKYSDKWCIENVNVPPPNPEHVDYIGILPSDFHYFLNNNLKLGFTLDTCHIQIMVNTCEEIYYKNKLNEFPGLYEKNKEEIRDIVLQGDQIYYTLAQKTRHIHLSDGYKQGYAHGEIPGEGLRTVDDHKSFFIDYLKNIQQDKIGVVLEVIEEDFVNNSNTYKSFKKFKEIFNDSP